jgi:DNA helicase II / ATP-dependent DNA helicase PcrA
MTVTAQRPSIAIELAYLAKLNPQQRSAVQHGVGVHDAAGEPLLIIAGAGSGKTNTLAHRVAHLIVHGADPQRILLLTFSRRAAQEMTRRAERIVSSATASASRSVHTRLAWSGTFHSIGGRLLREYAERIGLAPSFTINDRADAADLLNLLRHELTLSAKGKRFPTKDTCLAIYSRAINTETALAEVLATRFPWCAEWEADLRRLFAAYAAEKQRQHVLDYDDLLLYWAQMMTDARLATAVGARFDHVLVDEYQDTNRLQASILARLKPDGRGLTVVGDDAQSIYSFRGATVRNILDFPSQFSVPARVMALEQNYRSTVAILAASNAVIGLAAERFTKNLWSNKPSAQRPALISVVDEQDQAQYVADHVLAKREAGTPLKAQAVLFRSAHHSAQLEIELARRGIPFVKFGGLKFLESAHVKDTLAILRWAENPRDRVAGFRILQCLPGVGPRTAGRILDQLDDAAAPRTPLAALTLSGLDADSWQPFAALMTGLRTRCEWPAEMAAVRLWYEPHLERRHDDAAARGADLAQLERIAATYASRERFLTELTLDPPEATSDEAGPPALDEDYLILSTIHSAKGQEWHTVYILNAVDGCLPSDLGTGSRAEIDEERRLLYVAMTRAKEELEILVPQRFYIYQQARYGDAHVYAQRTRFIPVEALPLFDCRTWPVRAPPPTQAHEIATNERIDIAARVRALWLEK